MAGMRDKIVHEYANIDWEEVWKVATEDTKELKTLIESVLDDPKIVANIVCYSRPVNN